MNPLELNIEVQKVDADGTKCYTCNEPMFGKMYQYFLFEGERVSETKYKVCETCHELCNE